MSSKALTLTAAIASACAVALGQTTSQNVVGYINIDLTANQYALIANQLDNGKGNKVGDLLAGVPENTTIAKFLNSKGGFEAANTYVGGTQLQAGTLKVGNNTALGTGVLTAAAGTTLANDTALTLANNAGLQLTLEETTD